MMEWILGGSVIASVMVLVGFTFHNNGKNDAKVARVYQRLDEVKKDNETRYTNKDVCQILHRTVDEKLDKIDRKLDKILNGQNK